MSRLTQSGMPKGKPFPENELVWLDCPECEYHVRVHQSTQEANMRQHKEKGCPLVTTGDDIPEVKDRSPLELQAPLCPEPCSDCTCLPSNWYDHFPLAPATSPEPISRDPSPWRYVRLPPAPTTTFCDRKLHATCDCEDECYEKRQEHVSRDPSLSVEPTPLSESQADSQAQDGFEGPFQSHSWEPLRKALSDEGEQVGKLTSSDEKKYADYLARENAPKLREFSAEGYEEYFSKKNKPAPTILEEAGELVDGPREAHYGHPYDDFSRAIGAFNALFEDYLKQPLEVRHWPLIMQLVKLSREINEPKRDNWVDGAGYWRTLEKVMDHEDEGQYR